MKALTTFDDFREMLADPVRMSAFRRAVFETVTEGDVVVDLGAGTGILGFWALQAGARRVHLIEKSDAIELARQVAAHNGWLDRVVLHAAASTEVELEPADVLLSETLGAWAIDENTLPFTIDARRRLLKPGGRMVPRSLQLWLAPVEAPEVRRRRRDFWRDVGGVDMSPAIALQSRKLSYEDIDTDALLGPARMVAGIDLATVEDPTLRVEQRFVMRRAGRLDGLAGWFSAQLCPGVTLSTAPDHPPTHWRRAFLPLGEPVGISAGDILDLALVLEPGDGDQTRLHTEWFCSQHGLDGSEIRHMPCPCGSGHKFRRCCGR